MYKITTSNNNESYRSEKNLKSEKSLGFLLIKKFFLKLNQFMNHYLFTVIAIRSRLYKFWSYITIKNLKLIT